MPYQVTRREVVTNAVLMPEVTSNTIPSGGWQYHADGQKTYVYRFATWASNLDTAFPPNITGGGTIRGTYWYLETGGDGPPQYAITAYAMFLGTATEDAIFNNDNPIEKVNGVAYGGDRTVGTLNGAIHVDPKTTLQHAGVTQYFQEWVVLWGNAVPNGSVLDGPDHGYGAAVAIYGPKPVKPFKPGDLTVIVEQILTKRDLIADFLDERRRQMLEDFVQDMQARSTIAEATAGYVADRDTVQRKLVQVRAEMNRLAAIAEILDTIARRPSH